ncbi:unnamed protein product [Rhodiola kirilowii]
MEDGEQQVHEEEANLSSSSDLCQQLMDRYKASSAKQHRHLLATAAAMRSVISSESLPLTPTAYFAATISSLSRSSQTPLDADAVGALTSLLSLALPLVPPKGIASEKAVEAVEILVELLNRQGANGGLVSASSVRAVVKCLGVLLAGFCDSGDWNSLHSGLQTLLKFSVDKRPKVRKCALAYVEKIFSSFEDPSIKKEASNLVASLFETYLPSIVELSNLRLSNGSTIEAPSRPELVEALHMLNVLKLAVPFLSTKMGSKFLKKLLKLMHSESTALTRHILIITDTYFLASKFEVISSSLEKILVSFSAYLTKAKNTPLDTEKAVLDLLRRTVDRVNCDDHRVCVKWLPVVFGSILENIMSNTGSAIHASSILKQMISQYVDRPDASCTNIEQFTEDEYHDRPPVLGLCRLFEDVLKRCEGIPNEHILGVVSVLFLKLGISSFIFMRVILQKLADLMIHSNGTDTTHLQHCIGAAVIAMGPEKVLTILPIILNDEDFTCSNTWLIPVLRKYVDGASLDFYMNHIMSLAESLQQACRKAKNIVIRKELKAHARALRALLTAFCRRPRDAYQNIGPLSKLLITFIKKDSYMHGIVAVAIQELLDQNTRSDEDGDYTCCFVIKDFNSDLRNLAPCSQKAVISDSGGWVMSMTDILEALTDLFHKSAPEKRLYLQSAIERLVSIVGSSTTKRIFLSSVEKFQSITDLVDQEEKTTQRCLLLELASSFSKGADEPFLAIIFDFIKLTLQGNVDTEHCAAFSALSKIIQERANYCSTRLNEVMDLMYPLKSNVEKNLLVARFKALHALLVLLIKENREEEEEKAFLILNEIILKMKDSDEEARKVAYDTLLAISSSLHDHSCSSFETYKNFITMVTGYLCGASPQTKSGAISALSILVYKDPQVCVLLPDVLPSVLSLLESKSMEVIKAILGFVKVLVSCLQAKDLQTLLPDIVNGILPWSSVSRNHFRTKIIIIMEIMIRKCGSAAIESVIPKKYDGFIKTVRENRHGKTNSTEAEGTDDVKESPMENPKSWRKRKASELGPTDESNKRNLVDRSYKTSKDTRKSTFTKKPHEKETRSQLNSQHRSRGKECNPKFVKRNLAKRQGSKSQQSHPR